jgi:hypothetical protein
MALATDNKLVELARAACAGDPAALEATLQTLQPLIVRVARLVVGPGQASRKTLRKRP